MKLDLGKIYLGLRQNALKKAQLGGISFLAEPPEGTDFNSPDFAALHGGWFQAFIDHPQIAALLDDALYLWLVCMPEWGEDLDRTLLDRACNWCVAALQNSLGKEDAEVAAFRAFWKLLFTAVPMNQVRGEQIALFHRRGEIIGKGTEEMLERSLEQTFVPERPAYTTTLHRYRKNIRQYYQEGFIYLLGSFHFAEFYIPPKLQTRWGIHERTIPILMETAWQNIFDEDSINYVIGVPGSGKSLFLQNMMLNSSKMTFSYSQDYLMIYCDMKTYYAGAGYGGKPVVKFLQESMIRITGMSEMELSIDFIEYYLRMGRCLVLMDALDEVPKSERQHLHRTVITYFKTAHPHNKICITSRDRGFLPQGDINVLRIPSLTSQDIDAYIDRMIALKKFKKEDKARFLEQAKVLIEKHFLNSFLVLSLLVSIYKAEKELPENKIDLYKKCFEYIAKKREIEKGKDNYNWKHITPLLKDGTFIMLSTLAAPNNANIPREKIEHLLLEQYRLKYVDEATAETAVREFLEFCSARTELFVLAAEDQFKFFHRSFFEYFYARYITQQTSVADMYQMMSQFDVDSEIFELTVALVKEENESKYQELINYMFDRIDEEFHQPKPSFSAFTTLTMSMQVVDDAYYLKKYLETVTNYADLMHSRDAQKLDQKQIARRLQKIMRELPDLEDLFFQVYRKDYISFSVQKIADVGKARFSIQQKIKAPLRDMDKELIVENFTHQVIRLDPVPFYFLKCPLADAIREEVVHWGSEECKTFLSGLAAKDRKRRQASFKQFEKMPPAERKKLWKAMQEHGYLVI